MNYMKIKSSKLNSMKKNRPMEKRVDEFLCLICGRKGNHSIVVSSCQSYVSSSGTPLAKFLYKVIGEEPCYSVSEYICEQCFLLLDRLDTYQARAAELNHHISTRYKDTKFGYFGSRQRISELITSSLSNLKSFKNGTTLNVSDELSVTVFHETLPRGKIRSLNRTTSTFSNLIENDSNSSHVNNNLKNLYLKRKRTPPIKLTKCIKKQKGTLPTLILNNGICKDKNSKVCSLNEGDNYPNTNGVDDDSVAVNSEVSLGISKIEPSKEDTTPKLIPGEESALTPDNKTPASVSEQSDNEDSDNSTSSTTSRRSRKKKSSKSSNKSTSRSSSTSSNNSNSSSSSNSSCSSSSSCNNSSDSSSSSSSNSSSSSSDESSEEEASKVEGSAGGVEKETEERITKEESPEKEEPATDAIADRPIKEEIKSDVKMEEVTSRLSLEEADPQRKETEPLDAHIAEAMLMQNSLASNLLQSFLSTSLWMNSSEPSNQNIFNNLTKQQQNKINLLQKRNRQGITGVDSNSNAMCITDKKKRLELKNTGQSYVNTKGKLVEAKRVWPQDCSRCPLRCNGRLTEEMRLLIFADYWGLADYDLQREYLASHMEREERVGPSGYSRTVVLYYLTHEKKKVQVCRQFFLKTLDVSEKASRIVLEKKLKGELGAETIPVAPQNEEAQYSDGMSP